MKKKLLTIFLSLLCIFAIAMSCVACTPDSGENDGDKTDVSGDDETNANEEKPMEGLIFTLNADSETYTVKGTTLLREVETIVIPETYQGKPVTVIGDSGFGRNPKVTTITLPKSITIIGGSAFYECTALTSITIPENVKIIGSGAFYGCQSLSSVYLPEGLLEIRYNAFWNCSSLTEIVIPDSVVLIDYDVFTGSNLRYNVYDNGNYVGNENNPYKFLISVFNSAESCNVHEDTLYICTSAIDICDDLFKLTIHKNIKNINSWAFNICQDPFLIEFDGTLSEWEEVDKADGWNGQKSIVIRCSNGSTNASPN